MEHFFSPNSGEDQKKKGLHQKWNTFLSTDLRSDAHQSQIIGGDADEDHTQIVGGYTVIILRDISSPTPPCFGTTAIAPPLACQPKCKIKNSTFLAHLRLFFALK